MSEETNSNANTAPTTTVPMKENHHMILQDIKGLNFAIYTLDVLFQDKKHKITAIGQGFSIDIIEFIGMLFCKSQDTILSIGKKLKIILLNPSEQKINNKKRKTSSAVIEEVLPENLTATTKEFIKKHVIQYLGDRLIVTTSNLSSVLLALVDKGQDMAPINTFFAIEHNRKFLNERLPQMIQSREAAFKFASEIEKARENYDSIVLRSTLNIFCEKEWTKPLWIDLIRLNQELIKYMNDGAESSVPKEQQVDNWIEHRKNQDAMILNSN